MVTDALGHVGEGRPEGVGTRKSLEIHQLIWALAREGNLAEREEIKLNSEESRELGDLSVVVVAPGM